MTDEHPFRYDGRRVVVTGAASGIGAATCALLDHLGASIIAIDRRPVEFDCEQTIEADLGDPASIDAAVAAIDGEIDALFNIAGVPQTLPPVDVMRVNLLGLRHLTERLDGRIRSGGAVAHVASIAGNGWPTHLEPIRELLDTPDFAAGLAWCEAHTELLGDGYFFSKECVVVYTMLRSTPSIRTGVRMNCVSPGPVESPMMPAFRETIGSNVLEWTVEGTSGRMGEPPEIAVALAFCNCPGASWLNGHNLVVDGGFSPAFALGSLDRSTLQR